MLPFFLSAPVLSCPPPHPVLQKPAHPGLVTEPNQPNQCQGTQQQQWETQYQAQDLPLAPPTIPLRAWSSASVFRTGLRDPAVSHSVHLVHGQQYAFCRLPNLQITHCLDGGAALEGIPFSRHVSWFLPWIKEHYVITRKDLEQFFEVTIKQIANHSLWSLIISLHSQDWLTWSGCFSFCSSCMWSTVRFLPSTKPTNFHWGAVCEGIALSQHFFWIFSMTQSTFRNKAEDSWLFLQSNH